MINSAVEYQIFDPNSSSERSALQFMLQIFELQGNGQDNELCTIQLLLQFWNILFKYGGWNSDSDNLQQPNHNQARLQIMMQYIHEHYAEEITLEMIAASVSISKSGALHIFQSGIHCSPVAYLIQYRLAQAARQLYTTQKSVASIANETGFTSAGYILPEVQTVL